MGETRPGWAGTVATWVRRWASAGWPWQQVLLFLTIALAAAVRCTTLSFQSLWLDEIGTTVEAGRPWSALFLALFSPSQGYPLYILGMRVWIALFGTGEVALRLPSAIAGVCSVPLLYSLGRRLFGWKVGLLAAILLALSPLAAWYSQEARVYALAVLLSLASWLLLWEALRRRSRALWWAFGAVTLLSLFTHRLIAVLALVGQLVYVLYIARQGGLSRRYRWLLVGLLLAVLLGMVGGVWFVLGGEGAGRQFEAQRGWVDLAKTFTQLSLRIDPTPPEPGQGPDRRLWLGAFALAGLAGVGGLIEDIAARGLRRRRAVFLLCSLVVPLGTFFLLYLVRPFFYERYLLGALPAYLLLLAVGSAALWRWATDLARSSDGVLALFLGAVALATSLWPMRASWQQVQDWTFSRLPQKEQFREATLYLQQHLHPGDLVVAHPGYIADAARFYQTRFPRVPLELHTIPDLNIVDYGYREFGADMDALATGRRRAWLFIAPYHASFLDPRNWVYEWFYLNPFWHCDEQHFNGVDLYCISWPGEYRVVRPLMPQIPLNAVFGQELLLYGADLQPFQQPLQPGDSLPLTLYAEALQQGLPDLEAAVVLVGSDGRVWAEASRQPLGGYLPTSKWLLRDEVLDGHELLLPDDLPAGHYRVQVSYRPAADPAAPLLLPDGAIWTAIGTVEVVDGGGR